MNKYLLSEALNELPDDLLLEAVEVERKPAIMKHIWQVAACLFCIFTIALGSVVFIRTNQTNEQTNAQASTSEIIETNPPMLGIQVQAGSSLVELGANVHFPIFGGEKTTDPSQIPNPPADRNMYVYNTITGEWELMQKTAEDLPPRIAFVIWIHKYLETCKPYLVVFKDGIKVDLTDKFEPNISRSLAFLGDDKMGWQLTCNFEKRTTLVIQVRDSASDILNLD